MSLGRYVYPSSVASPLAPSRQCFATCTGAQDDRSRFVESLKKKFARLEAERLEDLLQGLGPSGKPECECLVGGVGDDCVTHQEPLGASQEIHTLGFQRTLHNNVCAWYWG